MQRVLQIIAILIFLLVGAGLVDMGANTRTEHEWKGYPIFLLGCVFFGLAILAAHQRPTK